MKSEKRKVKNLIAKARMLAVWLRRLGHCRGFGVQSPSAYAFIRYVINEHYPYYAYDDMLKAWPDTWGVRLKLCRLYFRLANYAQAERWAWCGMLPEAERQYISCGCRRTVTAAGLVKAKVGVASMRATGEQRKTFVEQFVTNITAEISPGNKTFLIIEGIGHDAAAKTIWQQLKADKRVGVTFDLYYCGIAFFDKRFKQDYIVNF